MGRVLSSLLERECRYPTSGEGDKTRFCAAEVDPDQWTRGLSGDRYCDHHRAICLGIRGAVDNRAFVTWGAPGRARLAGVAKAKGYQPSKYAQLLFEAVFAARVGQERDGWVDDVELDEQVRLVFACCGEAEPKAIAKATGIPIERVEHVLKGLRLVGKGKRGKA